MSATHTTEVWLLRHGEIASYVGDNGLTARGEQQAREAAARIAAELAAPSVELLHATSVRALETARCLGEDLRAHDVAVDGPAPDPGFDNLRVVIDGEVRPHDDLRAAIVHRRAEEGWPPSHRRDWEHEAHRFASIHDGGGDPIQWWLTQPTLAYEPPGIVVRRFWRALAALAERGAERVVACSHSGCLRALAAQAAGRDLGEPAHLEAVRVSLAGGLTGDAARLEYRGEIVELAVPSLAEPAWQ
ncbi:MAG: histidine phosphatase family protein [Deltaproteobacteria bacterium]|nr:histidine phosphatase family protein [Deltaproteobacteria bacterium]